MQWQTPFVEPTALNDSQLFFMTLVYGVVLYQASQLICGGSELLMLVPAIAGIVGSIVLPILGAVPDGMMVLFSGIGPNAQETVSVGVGALAGSTVMLLTFPWFIAVTFGGVPLNSDGAADYSLRTEKAPVCRSGIKYGDSIRKGAKVMLATTALYFVIQIPSSYQESEGADTSHQAKGEHLPSLLGLVACIAAFTGYLVLCFAEANEDKALAKVVEAIKDKKISFPAVLDFFQTPTGSARDQNLLDSQTAKLKKVLRPLFDRYDLDRSNKLSMPEVKLLVQDLNLPPRSFMNDLDRDADGEIDFGEFAEYLNGLINDPMRLDQILRQSTSHNLGEVVGTQEDDDEEDVEMPSDIASMNPGQQRMRILMRSFWMMGLGTVLVLLFSDPMVDALSEWGNRLGISPFYISFILAPFASNASELLSAYNYATKKSQKSMTTSLSTLIGASCMNNTFVLAIFLALIYVQGLAWQFTAETIAMVLIQWVIGILAIKSETQTFTTATIILLCYPSCLFIVWFLENVVGLD